MNTTNEAYRNDRPVTAIIVGAGNRSLKYAAYALSHPDKLRIVGVVDPEPVRRRHTAETYGFGEEMIFETTDQLALRPKLADAVINGTMDHLHVPTSLPLLRKGYDLLLEKPIGVSEAEVRELYETATGCGRRVMICHAERIERYARRRRHPDRAAGSRFATSLDNSILGHLCGFQADVSRLEGRTMPIVWKLAPATKS